MDRSLNLNARAKKNDRRPASKFLVSGYWNGVGRHNLLVFSSLVADMGGHEHRFCSGFAAGKASSPAYAKILRLKSLHRKEP